MKFKELTLRNFLSYGNNVTTIKLDSSKPTLIVGKNYDSIVDGQIDSNGSGKCLRGNSKVNITFESPEIEEMFKKFLNI